MATHQRVILFNGPPRSGKDTAVNYCMSRMVDFNWLKPQHIKIAAPLKAATYALYQAPAHVSKDTPSPHFQGRSFREALIEVSEKMVKPVLGQDFFGWIAAKTIDAQRDKNVWLCSDLGFVEELGPIVHCVGRKHVLVIEIHATRGGTPLSFEGDSRSYIGAAARERFEVCTMSIPNIIGDRPMFETVAWGAVQGWLKGAL